VAYTPALDISTSGKSMAEVKRRFTELVGIFFEELAEAGTTEDVLLELGWTKQGRAQSLANWRPPVIKNENLAVRIPVSA
jgi:hypothetical protein